MTMTLGACNEDKKDVSMTISSWLSLHLAWMFMQAIEGFLRWSCNSLHTRVCLGIGKVLGGEYATSVLSRLFSGSSVQSEAIVG